MKTNRQTKKSEPYEKEEKKSYFPLSHKERRQNACTQRRFPHRGNEPPPSLHDAPLLQHTKASFCLYKKRFSLVKHWREDTFDVRMSPFPPRQVDKELLRAISKKSKEIQALQNITVHFRKDCRRNFWGYISARQWHLQILFSGQQ